MSWYYKLTFSDRYMNFWSQQPVSQKIGTIAGIGTIGRIILLSNPKFHLDNLCFIIIVKEWLPIEFYLFENINNRLKKIITSNRKSVVNDNRIEVMQPLWFTFPFVRGITEKFRLNSQRMRISFIVLINYENSGCIRTLYRIIRSRMLFFRVDLI